MYIYIIPSIENNVYFSYFQIFQTYFFICYKIYITFIYLFIFLPRYMKPLLFLPLLSSRMNKYLRRVRPWIREMKFWLNIIMFVHQSSIWLVLIKKNKKKKRFMRFFSKLIENHFVYKNSEIRYKIQMARQQILKVGIKGWRQTFMCYLPTNVWDIG